MFILTDVTNQAVSSIDTVCELFLWCLLCVNAFVRKQDRIKTLRVKI